MVLPSFFINCLHLDFYSKHVLFLQLEKNNLLLFGERDSVLFYVIIAWRLFVLIYPTWW